MGIKLTLLKVVVSITSLNAAYDIVSPKTVCERFISAEEQKKCEQKAKLADTYVTSVCQEIFDDKIFDDCLALATQHPLDPKKISACTGDAVEDMAKLKCLQKLAQSHSDEYQRVPASISKSKSAGPQDLPKH